MTTAIQTALARPRADPAPAAAPPPHPMTPHGTPPHQRGAPVLLGPEREHYWLALGMAQTLGLDLTVEIAQSRFSQAEWADLVQRCRGCTWSAECRGWLMDHDTAPQAPGRCVNAGRFDALLGARAGDEDA